MNLLRSRTKSAPATTHDMDPSQEFGKPLPQGKSPSIKPKPTPPPPSHQAANFIHPDLSIHTSKRKSDFRSVLLVTPRSSPPNFVPFGQPLFQSLPGTRAVNAPYLTIPTSDPESETSSVHTETDWFYHVSFIQIR